MTPFTTGPSGTDQKNADDRTFLTALGPIDRVVRRTEELRNG